STLQKPPLSREVFIFIPESLRMCTTPLYVVIAIIFLNIISCGSQNSQPENVSSADTIPSKTIADPSIAGNFNPETTLRFDSTRIDSFLRKYPELKSYKG